MKGRNFIVKGEVQGVGFRYFTVRVAQKCGVNGWVRNLPDGSVEAYAEGDVKSLEAFHGDLLRGPTMSHVTEVVVSEEQPSGRYSSFEIRY